MTWTLCRTCGLRWGRSVGLCARCAKMAGVHPHRRAGERAHQKRKACTRCWERWGRSPDGLCCRCARETGAEAKALKAVAIPYPDRQPRPAKHRLIAGIEYEVIWDGS